MGLQDWVGILVLLEERLSIGRSPFGFCWTHLANANFGHVRVPACVLERTALVLLWPGANCLGLFGAFSWSGGDKSTFSIHVIFMGFQIKGLCILKTKLLRECQMLWRVSPRSKLSEPCKVSTRLKSLLSLHVVFCLGFSRGSLFGAKNTARRGSVGFVWSPGAGPQRIRVDNGLPNKDGWL